MTMPAPVNDPDREQQMDWLRGFVAGSSWRFAKTYVQSYPHEYTLERTCDAGDFSKAISCIEHWGVLEPFWGAHRKYLYLDGRKYWHMGDAFSAEAEGRPTLINRTWVDVANYRDAAKALGYDDEHLDRLVTRWKILLERARGRS
jgi:hypothetical protein